MPSYQLDTNLGLPSTPQGVPDGLFSEFNRLYNAVRSIASYISSLADDIAAITANRGAATLSAGTVTIASTTVTASTRIFLTTNVLGTVTIPWAMAVTSRVPGVSFTVTSANPSDTSSIAWMFF